MKHISQTWSNHKHLRLSHSVNKTKSRFRRLKSFLSVSGIVWVYGSETENHKMWVLISLPALQLQHFCAPVNCEMMDEQDFSHSKNSCEWMSLRQGAPSQSVSNKVKLKRFHFLCCLINVKIWNLIVCSLKTFELLVPLWSMVHLLEVYINVLVFYQPFCFFVQLKHRNDAIL